MKKNVDISIIVANYNYASFLPDALNSVLAQTIDNWECIIIDDGSTDNSVEIIKKYVKKDSRFQLIQIPHSGVSVARNTGLDAARGEYIAFLDSDDWLELNTYEKLAKEIENNPDIDLIQFGHKTISNKTREIKGYYNSLNYQNPNFIITPKTKIYFYICIGSGCGNSGYGSLPSLMPHSIPWNNRLLTTTHYNWICEEFILIRCFYFFKI